MLTKPIFDELDVEHLWDFLITGETDWIGEHGTIISLGQKLEPREALHVLHVLCDEHNAIKGFWELCERCGHISDSDYGGAWADSEAIHGDYHYRPEVIDQGGWYCDWCAPFMELPYDERPEDWREEVANTERILTWFAFIDADQQAERDTRNQYFLICKPDEYAALWLKD